jgi:cytochrome c553
VQKAKQDETTQRPGFGKGVMPQAMARQFCARRGRQTLDGVFAATTTFMLIIGGLTTAYGVDVELGRYLSSECMTCHGTAKADSTIPNIFGLGEAHFVEVIRAYRDKKLPNPVMQTIASRLKDDEIVALALYFQTAKKPK